MLKEQASFFNKLNLLTDVAVILLSFFIAYGGLSALYLRSFNLSSWNEPLRRRPQRTGQVGG